MKALDYLFFFVVVVVAVACRWIFIKRTVLKLDLLHDWKIYCSQACARTFQPGNLTGWGSEGVNLAYISAYLN